MSARPSTQEPDESALLAGVRDRDGRALDNLYRAYGAMVHGLALRIVQDPAEAEEITQDVFVYVWQQIDRFDTARGNLSAWLVTLARSRGIDRLRARGSRERRIEGLAREAAGGETSPLAGDPLLTVLQSERRVRVRGALDSLAPEQRQALEIAYFEGLSHTEIASRLEAPLGTVKTRIRQGMIRLRAALAEDATGGAAGGGPP